MSEKKTREDNEVGEADYRNAIIQIVQTLHELDSLRNIYNTARREYIYSK